MKKILKVCPCILKEEKGKWFILAFKHPIAGNQIPKGTVEPNEEIEKATLRELKEESGISEARIENFIGKFDRVVENEDGNLEHHEWHLFDVRAENNLPKNWNHNAEGSSEENGLVFHFFWQELSVDYKNYHEYFLKVLELVENYLKYKF
ncbi:MAG: NUDIX domain-containing protein [Calditrichaeota bacterium]|nr:MAG: NUDIX domain-containing protein [Calditrichota bacterium]